MSARYFKLLAVELLACLLSLSMMPSVQAVPTLSLSDGVNTVVISDGGAGDANGAAGIVTYVGAVGSTWFLNVTTGTTKPASGNPIHPYLNLNSVDATSSGGGTLTILWSDDFFGATSGNAVARIGGTTVGSVNYSAYADSANAIFGQTTPLTSLGAFGPGAFSGTDVGLLALGSPYSLTLRTVISHQHGGLSSFNADLRVPDGGTTLVLLGLAFLGLEGLRRQVTFKG